jgi:nucleoside-diphosphate-sugar epimerase
VANTTAEWIASWIGAELVKALADAGHVVRGRLRVTVDECLGQTAVWEGNG